MSLLVAEWLETDGLGGYASMPTTGARTRKYHGWYCSAQTPPVQRIMYISELLLTVVHKNTVYNLTPQCYENTEVAMSTGVECNVITWPKVSYVYTIKSVGTVTFEYQLIKNNSIAECSFSCQWTDEDTRLFVRPLCKFADHHTMTQISNGWSFLIKEPQKYLLQNSNKSLYIYTNGTVQYEPLFYEHIKYSEEEKRGYENKESLYSFGQIICSNSENTFVYFSTNIIDESVKIDANNERKRRQKFSSHIHKTADDFIVERHSNDTRVPAIIAGYPWFTDWGRDTFIAMRGLLLAQEHFEIAESILLYWASQLRNGLLPNRFIDESNTPEYNSVDSPLWFCIATYEYCTMNPVASTNTVRILQDTCKSIVQAWQKGTEYNIAVDEQSGLVYSGTEGVQLTWMDAKYGDVVVTPRIGFPVEIQCLWINVLHILVEWKLYNPVDLIRVKESFIQRFWNEKKQCLYDYITHDRQCDDIRPNQIFAIGGLPFTCIDDVRKISSILTTVQNALYTPLGLRTLSTDNIQYHSAYEGSQEQRDSAYHQGTAWPWLLGPFCDAMALVYGISPNTQEKIRCIWSACLQQSQQYGLGGICEIANADDPYTPNGCPWQAWSIGEYLRIAKKYNV